MRSVVLVWDEFDIPPHVRAVVDALRRYVDVRVVAVRRDAVPKVLEYLHNYDDDETPPQYRPLISMLKRFGVKQLPALVVDGEVAAEGNHVLVLSHLNAILWSAATA